MGKLIAIAKKSLFETLLRDPNGVDPRALTFILDTGQLYTHGVYINSIFFGNKASGAIDITAAGTTETLALSSHSHSNYFERNNNLDISTYIIKSGNNDLLKYASSTIYLGNTSTPLTLQSSGDISVTKGNKNATLLDTDNFSITNSINKATFKYGTSSVDINYVRRVNVSSAFDGLLTSAGTSAGTIGVNGKLYGIITLYLDGTASNPKYALIRVDTTDGLLSVRTSASPSNWIDIKDTWTAWVPATQNNNGTAGYMPAPGNNNYLKFLRGDGTWCELNNYTLESHTHPYTLLTGSGTTADLVIVSTGTANEWALKTLGSRAFDSTDYWVKGNFSATNATAMGWGTLTTANGYSILNHFSSSDGGDGGFVSKGGLIFMQIDGFFYQNEGLYRCLDTNNYSSYALPLSGGTLTGDLTFKSSNISIKYLGSLAAYSMIKFKDNTNDAWGNGIYIGGGGLTIIGGGESSDVMAALHSSGGDENMMIGNDGAIEFYSNLLSGWDYRKTMTLDTNGKLYAEGGFSRKDTTDAHVLLGGGGYKSLVNLQITGTATTITSLDITKTFIFATISADATLGLSSAMEVGQNLTVLISNSSSTSIAITVPSGWDSLDGSTLTCGGLKFLELDILCYASGAYMVSSKAQ